MTMDKTTINDKLSHKCLIRIQSVYGTLKTAEKKAADFMLQNPDKIAEITVIEAAELAGCSEATLVRLARKLGFNGYPELKTSILLESNEGETVLYKEISVNDDPLCVAHKIFQTSLQSLTDTLSLLDQDTYLKALDLFRNADRILFAGTGDAYTVAYTGYLKFSRVGFNCVCTKDFDIQLIEASKLTSNDLLVAISHAGRTQTLYDVVKCAKHREANVIAITNYPISPIAKLADIVLLTATFFPNVFGEVMTKRIPEFCLIESLYVNVVMRSEKALNTLKTSNKVISINKM